MYLHKIMVSPTKENGLKETRNKDNNITVDDYAPQNILPHHLNNKTKVKIPKAEGHVKRKVVFMRLIKII